MHTHTQNYLGCPKIEGETGLLFSTIRENNYNVNSVSFYFLGSPLFKGAFH